MKPFKLKKYRYYPKPVWKYAKSFLHRHLYNTKYLLVAFLRFSPTISQTYFLFLCFRYAIIHKPYNIRYVCLWFSNCKVRYLRSSGLPISRPLVRKVRAIIRFRYASKHIMYIISVMFRLSYRFLARSQYSHIVLYGKYYIIYQMRETCETWPNSTSNDSTSFHDGKFY